MSEIQGDLGQQLETLRTDLNQLRGDMSEMLQLLVKTGKTEATDFRDKLQNGASRQMSALRQKATAAREKGEEMADRVGVLIEDNPMSSVLAALGVGFLLGLITSRK